jgi:hypothetical protein
MQVNKFFSRAAIAAALLAVAGIASAATAVVSVDSQANSIVGGSGLDSGVFLTEGVAFTVTSTGTWQNDPNPYYISTAAGHTDTDQGISTSSGYYTFYSGELVGEIGNSGVYFGIGDSYSGVATSSGTLNLFYWDSDAGNNSGAVSSSISVVPEPANVALIAMGLAAFALSRRRKA